MSSNKKVKYNFFEELDCLEKENGGWSLSPDDSQPDSDVTAMALTALSKNRIGN